MIVQDSGDKQEGEETEKEAPRSSCSTIIFELNVARCGTPRGLAHQPISSPLRCRHWSALLFPFAQSCTEAGAFRRVDVFEAHTSLRPEALSPCYLAIRRVPGLISSNPFHMILGGPCADGILNFTPRFWVRLRRPSSTGLQSLIAVQRPFFRTLRH